MIVAIADTHAAVWNLFDDVRLSRRALEFIRAAANARHKIGVSAITLAEIVYLVEKERLPADAYMLLRGAIANPEHVFTAMPVTNAIVDSMRGISRSTVPDLPDRLIAATALHWDVPVLSCDRCIAASKVQTIW